jgi:hypothetical protein
LMNCLQEPRESPLRTLFLGGLITQPETIWLLASVRAEDGIECPVADDIHESLI